VISASTFRKTFKPAEDELFVVRVQPVQQTGPVMLATSTRPAPDLRVEELKQEYPDVLCTNQPPELPPLDRLCRLFH
jgi:hypothetical protein